MSVPTVDADQRPAYRNAYEHLAPLFAQYAALPQGDPRRERLRTELIAGYLPVARNIARRYSRRGEPSQDVEQVASVGLVLAVDRFDPGRGIDFLSFAIPTINGEVLRAISQNRNVKLRDVAADLVTAVSGQPPAATPRFS